MKKIHTLGAGLATLSLAALATAPGAYAAAGEVEVVNTETIQVYVDSEGEVKSQRVYEQLSLTGQGAVSIANPVEQSGLRNLDGFGGVSAEDGVQEVDVEVDGYERLRSVSNYTGDLPLEFSIEYVLDGEKIAPDDVVGSDGELEVIYTVKNVTGEPQEVSFPDGKGGTMTETVEVPIPIVGSMTTTVPSSFTDVTSEQANIAGDGKGGTKLSFTMTLFPPLGSDEMQFSYRAQVSDAVVPATSVTALPVNPLEIPTFKTAGDSYQSGADTGVRLAEGATTIDDNLLKLRDGAGTLLAGLIKLSDGSGQLSDGLAGQAAPGARKLADGLGQLDGGVGELDAGANKMADGQRKLAEGLETLYDGVDGLPASVRQALRQNEDYLALLGALTGIADGVGTRPDATFTDPKTLLQGINAIQAGMKYPGSNDCIVAATGQDPQKCGVIDALTLLSGLLAGTATGQVAPLADHLRAVHGSLGCPGDLATATSVPSPGTDCERLVKVYSELFKRGSNSLAAGVQQKFEDAALSLNKVTAKINDQLLAPGAGLDSLRNGLSNPAAGDCAKAKATSSPADDCGIREGALYLRNVAIPALVDGITANVRAQLVDGIGVPTPGCDPTSTLRCAAEALADGGDQLTAGIDQLVDGVTLLNDGGNQLADGLGEAADGSVRLADGTAKAAAGAPKLVDGADRLSKEGMSQLIAAGEETAQNYGKMYATIKAGAERADAEKMAYGAPEGAQGLTAYSYELLGDDGEGGRNTKRGLAALALLGLGGGAVVLRRRIV